MNPAPFINIRNKDKEAWEDNKEVQKDNKKAWEDNKKGRDEHI